MCLVRICKNVVGNLHKKFISRRPCDRRELLSPYSGFGLSLQAKLRLLERNRYVGLTTPGACLFCFFGRKRKQYPNAECTKRVPCRWCRRQPCILQYSTRPCGAHTCQSRLKIHLGRIQHRKQCNAVMKATDIVCGRQHAPVHA